MKCYVMQNILTTTRTSIVFMKYNVSRETFGKEKVSKDKMKFAKQGVQKFKKLF